MSKARQDNEVDTRHQLLDHVRAMASNTDFLEPLRKIMDFLGKTNEETAFQSLPFDWRYAAECCLAERLTQLILEDAQLYGQRLIMVGSLMRDYATLMRKLRNCESPVSDATVRRWIEDPTADVKQMSSLLSSNLRDLKDAVAAMSGVGTLVREAQAMQASGASAAESSPHSSASDE